MADKALCNTKAVFVLTHLHKAQDKYNWIRTSENYERVCLNK